MSINTSGYKTVLITNPQEATGSKKADFDAMYDLYANCFALPDEVQSKEEFIELLGKNATAHKAQEAWLGLKDSSASAISYRAKKTGWIQLSQA